ncbi:MAG: DUF6507 family protein [Ornithinimicrobium sp.]
MTTWDIQVAEIHQMLLTAGDSAAEYERHLGQLEEAVSELLIALPSSPHVFTRVDEFAQEVLHTHLRSIISQTSNALEGTMAALSAYQEADERMAHRANHEAAQMKPPLPPGAISARKRT